MKVGDVQMYGQFRVQMMLMYKYSIAFSLQVHTRCHIMPSRLSGAGKAKIKRHIAQEAVQISNLGGGCGFYQCYTATKTCRESVHFIKKEA